MYKISTVIVFLFFISITVKGQEKQANEQFDRYAYIDAIKTYERIAKKGYKSADLFQKLGDCYYFNGKLKEAAKWYKELFQLKVPINTEYYYRYAQSLKSVGEYDKANELLTKFSKLAATEQRSILYSENEDYLSQIEKNSHRYVVNSTEINSRFSDFGMSFFGDKLVFTSNREAKGFSKSIDKWTNNPFSELYITAIDSLGYSIGRAQKFSKKNDGKFHESTAVFTKDGTTMYFTRNMAKGGDSKKSSLLKIFQSKLIDGSWTEIKELSFNGTDYNTAHPALSWDEKTLYFASDRAGSFGASDIYKVEIRENGGFGEPENLGKKINTEGRETFPFESKTGELYFASDGHPGLGGIDIFVASKSNDAYSLVYNLGKPVNGPFDDFTFIINDDTKTGFFSSNRDGGKGDDDIYSFKELKKIEYACDQDLTGILTVKGSGEVMEKVEIALYDKNLNLLEKVYTDKNGKYLFGVECGVLYYIRSQKNDFTAIDRSIVIQKTSGVTIFNIQLEKQIKPYRIGTDLDKTFEIAHIYFDTNKFDITPVAAMDLQKIIEVMKEYSTIKIDVRSHTDSRGSDKYNLKLSDKRAKSTIKYLIENGISKDRLSGKGYGETQLINECIKEKKCSDEEHQENRRSEFIITVL